MPGRRSTTPLSDEQDLLVWDEDQIAAIEARNGLLQFDEVLGSLSRQHMFSKLQSLLSSLPI